MIRHSACSSPFSFHAVLGSSPVLFTTGLAIGVPPMDPVFVQLVYSLSVGSSGTTSTYLDAQRRRREDAHTHPVSAIAGNRGLQSHVKPPLPLLQQGIPVSLVPLQLHLPGYIMTGLPSTIVVLPV